MASIKIDDEKFVKKYGKKTTFTYSCELGKFKIFVYRITMTNEDGYSIDYTWDAIEKRCGELNIPTVPVLFKGPVILFCNPDIYSTIGEFVEQKANDYIQGSSVIDSTHIKEGIVLRIEGTSCPKTYKHKSFEFKVLEGIIKPETASVDESSEL